MTGPAPWRPTAQQLAEAYGRTVPDVIRPGLKVLFCGINPGLYSGAVGHHFARPGNRFWKTLHVAGFTRRCLSPFEERELLRSGLGRFRPAAVAFLGMGAFRAAFGRPAATVGPQLEKLCGARVWLLPNPSGLNAHYQLAALAAEFGRLEKAVSRRR